MQDDDTLDIDAASTFVSIGRSSWTIKGDTGDKLCLKSTSSHNTNKTKTDKRKFCLFDVTKEIVSSKWLEIHEIRRGCTSSLDVLEATSCDTIHPENG